MLNTTTLLAQGNNNNCPKLRFTTQQCCFTPGSVITFNWDGGCANSQVNLYLTDPNTLNTIATISTNLANSGYYTWTVPNNVPVGSYLLYIEDVGQSIWDYGALVTIAEDCYGDDCNCQPDFNFSIKNDGCSLSFSAAFNGNCRIEQVLWNFGDNTTSTDNNPTHSYPQNGTYQVCLTVTFTDLDTQETCTEKICREIKVESCIKCCPVTPVFTYQIQKCRVRFTSLNQSNDCSKIIAWSWDFGDGSPPSNQANPIHNYNQNGTYNVCLTATIQTTDGLTFQTIICRTVVIDECEDTGDCCPLNPGFNYLLDPNRLCNVIFNGKVSPDSCTNQTNWMWTFGDGNNSNLQNPIHVYSANGAYQVCLKVQYGSSDTIFCEDQTCQNLQITNCISDTTGCNMTGTIISQTNITCNITSSGSVVVQGVNGTAPYNYTLNSSSQLSGSFSNLPAGNHIIQINDANNCSALITVTISSENVTPVNATGNETICLGGSSQLSATPLGTFQWNPTTGLSCSTCPNPVANPVITTTYTVNHIDLNGCLSSDQITVSVGDSFDLQLPDLTICPGTSVYLNPTPVAGNYLWQPPIGLACTNCPSPESTLTQQTTYTVTVNNDKCVGTDQVTVFMHPSLGANFSWQSQGGLSVIFLASPTGLNSYTWDFGDPASGINNSATGVQVNHVFSTPNQNYTICMIANDDCGPVRICHPIFIDVDCANLIQMQKNN